MKKSWSWLVSALAATIAVLFVGLDSYQKLQAPLFSNDLIAWLLPAQAYLHDLGAAYSHYWDIKPPGLILMTILMAAFGSPLWLFHVYSLLFNLIICWLFWNILRSVFPRPLSLFSFTLSLLIFFSPNVQTQLLASEINGLLFVLAGILLLLRDKPGHSSTFWTAFLIVLAGQMKEVYALSLIAFVPLLLRASLKGWPDTLRIGVQILAGGLTALAIIFGYLLASNSFAAYQEVMSAKSNEFKLDNMEMVFGNMYHAAQFPRDRFFAVKYQFPFLLVAMSGVAWLYGIFESKLKVSRAKDATILAKINLPSGLYTHAIMVFWWLGMWLGYILQNRFGNKYEIAVILPLYVLTAQIATLIGYFLWSVVKRAHFKWQSQLETWGPGIITLGIFLLLAVPHKIYLLELRYQIQSFRAQEYVARWQRLEPADMLASEQLIQAATTKDECIQAVYGWGVGSVYYYANRKPCTRHFIPNIVSREQIAEYRTALISSPPAAIHYSVPGSDLNVAEFETTVFNYSQVLANCYLQDTHIKSLYWPKPAPAGQTQLSDCISEAAVSTVSATHQ